MKKINIKKKILITGGCGFIGTNLAKELIKDYDLLLLDNFYRYGSKINQSYLKKLNLKILNIDINNKIKLNKIDFNPDIIIHLASETSVSFGLNSDPSYLLKTNTIGLQNILEKFKKKNLIFIFLSTSRVYSIDDLNKIGLKSNNQRYTPLKSRLEGLNELGINESFSTNGRKSFYGLSKIFSEDLLKEYSFIYDMKIIINRCGLISGYHQWGKFSQGIMSYAVLSFLNNKEFNITGFNGTGLQVRDFLNVKDLLSLIKSQIKNVKSDNFKIFNVGGGINNSFSINELLISIENILGHKIKINRIKRSHSNDIPFYISDISKVKREFNWEPKNNLYDTINDLVDFIKLNIKHFKKI